MRVGGRYRLDADNVLEVRAVDAVPVRSIRAADVRAAGFDSRDALLAELERTSRRSLAPDDAVHRVRFRCVGERDPRAAQRTERSAAALDEVAARLARIDARSTRGPWTRAVLELVERLPRERAAELARELGRETRAFKADVRKLKELGLTESHDVGYSLSPRGAALLARLRAR